MSEPAQAMAGATRPGGYAQRHSALYATVACVLLAVWPIRHAGAGSGDDAATLFQEGVSLFEAGHFEEATERFSKAVELSPGESRYHLWLGRSYGRTAEHANWLVAVRLALKTRAEMEKAVSLDGNNVEALEDLREYYRRAPGFLGGSDRKAEELGRRLAALGVEPDRGGAPESTAAGP